jgi:serine incorporator 1/3
MWGVRTSNDWRAGIQNGYWGIKWFIWICLIVLTFFLPNGFIAGWGRVMNMPGSSFS